ncbi:uncharacterized protein SCHCODRAFT_02570171 [Schizophyllum commune H4-8]|nr:uncharacterized protein SCHCODRAFT_02570171 [Schizophyllum commune H4-8]KAI5896935.1 hypothetical protein SCHCODRAFT_02570171 [Schizophyllum commune H4-8]
MSDTLLGTEGASQAQGAVGRNVALAVCLEHTLARELQIHRSLFPLGLNATILRTELHRWQDFEDGLNHDSSDFQSQRTMVEKIVAVDHSLLAPWRRLPPEIWSDIFLCAEPEHWNIKPCGRRTLNLAQVCFSWRKIAFEDTPDLWNIIDIDADRNPPFLYYEGIQEEIRRSGDAPLYICFDSVTRPYQEGPSTMPWWDMTFKLLCSQSHRWLSYSSERSYPYMYAWRPAPSFPLLRQLAIGLLPPLDGYPVELPLRFFVDAPSLRTVNIDSVDLPLPYPGFIELPTTWAVQSLDISCGGEISDTTPPLAICLDAVWSCSQTLRKCTLWVAEVGILTERSPAMDFPLLEDLTLSLAGVHLCRFMSAPSLKSLSVSGSGAPSVSPAAALLSDMIDRSSGCTSLRSLRLEFMHVDPYQLINCLWRMQGLVSLTLQEFDFVEKPDVRLISKEVIRALTRRRVATGAAENHVLLPHLTDLTLHLDFRRSLVLYTGDVLFARDVYEMLRSRRKPLLWRGEPLPGLLTGSVPILLDLGPN